MGGSETSCRKSYLQGFGVNRRKAGQVGEDLECRVSGLVRIFLHLGGLILQVLGKLLGLCVPACSEGGQKRQVTSVPN